MTRTKNIFRLAVILCFIAGSALGNDAMGCYNTGVDQERKGDLDGALTNYNQAIQLSPNYFKAYNNRGGIKQVKGDLNGAIADYTKAIEIKPDHVTSYYGRAYVEQRKGDWNGAIIDYTKAIELKPDTDDFDARWAYYGRGTVRDIKEDLNGAIADFTKAIELKPDATDFYMLYSSFRRGSVRAKKGDVRGAVADFTKAIEIKPDYAEAYDARGWQKIQKNDLAGALADFSTEIKIKPDFAPAYIGRSEVKKAYGDPKGALEDYNKALELSPDVARRSTPDENWVTVASSADGSKLIAGSQSWSYCISTNSGKTWTTNNQPQKSPVAASADGTKFAGICVNITQKSPVAMYGGWSHIAASADGTKFAGICANVIWISTNSGATWFSNKVSGAAYLGSVAFLANGNKMVAVDQGHIAEPTVADSPGFIYMSTNLGVSWTRTMAPAMYWSSVAASVDGTRVIAAARGNQDGPNQGGPVYISTNSGVTWKPAGVPFWNQWISVASSADGQKLVAASEGVFVSGRFDLGSIFTSTNYGMTWKLCNLPHAAWYSVATSADGTSLAAAARWPGRIYTSIDSGTMWTSNNVPNEKWCSVALSADGNQLAAVSMGIMYPDRSSIYISRPARHKTSRVFAINYELKSPGKNYGPFFAAITNSPAWHHVSDSTWLVYTSETPAEISNRLSPHLVKGDFLLIIEARKNFNGSVPKEAWDWINLHAAE